MDIHPAPSPRPGPVFAGALGTAIALGLLSVAALAATRHPDVPAALAAARPWLALALAGVMAGLLAGALGIGGSLVTVPALYWTLPGLGVSTDAALPQAVVATALVAMLPTALAAARASARKGLVDGAWARRLAGSMVAGAAAGSVLALHLPGVFLGMAFVALSVWNGVRLVRGTARSKAAGACRPTRSSAPLLAPLIAAFSACVGMGGGSLVSTCLAANGLALHRAVATTSVLNLAIAAGGVLGIVFAAAARPLATPVWSAALVLGALAVLAAPTGVAIARRLSEGRLRVAVGWTNLAGASCLVLQLATPAAVRADHPLVQPASDVVAAAPVLRESANDRAPARVSDWPQHAVNVLLVPWLDDSRPVAWAPATEATPCHEVVPRIDGEGPIRAGDRLPNGPFVLRLRLVGCRAWDSLDRTLDGEVELAIAPGPDRLVVELRPRALTVTEAGVRSELVATTTAVVWLDRSPGRP